ncbi:leucyl aminopeptidase [Elioraea thermophila]|uniref:leucyl aminopeptidase n=1 Tax=Elioraea thermophila TaxID=2185104 RepID=UPI000DF2C5C5|nr:leucyl aminopeptidase [Elioraea thermophila]
MLEVSFAKPALPEAGALALLVGEDEPPSGLRAAADDATGGAIGRALAAANFKAKKNETVTILAPGAGLSRVVVVGLGKRAEAGGRATEEAAGTAAAALAQEPAAVLDPGPVGPAQAAEAALGATLRAWRFDRYRTKEKPEDKPKFARLTVAHDEPAKARAAWGSLKAVAEGVFFTREVVTEPPNVLTPAAFAERCQGLARLGLEVEVLGPKEMKKLGFGAFLGVAQGSANEPRLVVLQWHGATGGEEKAAKGKGKAKADASKPLAFIGKGITFDTGGVSLKPAQGMEDMKWDMAGAGAVAGLMAALAGRKAKVDAVGLLGLAENMPSGTAQRPGDVVTTASGQTVEVLNTDAEGRLVLADVLWYCQDRFDPRVMIDLATLTGAIVISLGHEHAGLFSNDEELAQKLIACGQATGELLWRMPLAEAYDKMLKSDIADMKNIGGRPGGAITAAQFLQRFVNGKAWAHLDIAGTAWTTKDKPCVPKGATAFGVRLLDRLVAEYYERG